MLKKKMLLNAAVPVWDIEALEKPHLENSIVQSRGQSILFTIWINLRKNSYTGIWGAEFSHDQMWDLTPSLGPTSSALTCGSLRRRGESASLTHTTSLHPISTVLRALSWSPRSQLERRHHWPQRALSQQIQQSIGGWWEGGILSRLTLVEMLKNQYCFSITITVTEMNVMAIN